MKNLHEELKVLLRLKSKTQNIYEKVDPDKAVC